MTAITLTRVALAILAMGMFLFGVRVESTPLRWAAVALLLVAFTLRFYKPKS